MESIRKETVEKDSSKVEEVKKVRPTLCRICRDTGAIHPPYPDPIRRYFRRYQVRFFHLNQVLWDGEVFFLYFFSKFLGFKKFGKKFYTFPENLI